MKARASREMAPPVADQSDLLNEAAVVIGKAKFVAAGVLPVEFTWFVLTPCVDSLHQLYALRPSDAIAGA